MNKQKFVEFLRAPENISTSQFQEIEQILAEYPYFSIAKSIAARASKSLDVENKNQLISSAAIYATDRKHLKKYVNGDVIFLAVPPSITESEEKEAPKTKEGDTKRPQSSQKPSESAIPEKMKAANSDVDQILDELSRDMEALKKSRLHFAEVQNLIDGSEPARPPYKPKTEKTEEKASEQIEGPTKEVANSKNSKDLEKEEDKGDSGNISSLIDSLKKEFEEEEVSEKESKAESKIAAPKQETAEESVEDTSSEKEKVDEKSETQEVEEKETEKEEKIEEVAQTQPPSPSSKAKPSIVTNMDDGDEEDEEDGVLDPNDKPVGEAPTRKTSARASRGSRQKVKREDLEKMMGITAKPSTKKAEPKSPPEKSDEKESTAKKTVEEKKEEKPAKKTTKAKKSPAKKKKDEDKKETKPKARKTIKKKAPEKESEKEETKQESKTESSTPEAKTESTTKQTEEDLSTRSSARAFLDFGGSGDMSASVSRASSSRRKRKRSPNSSSDSGEKKGGDDDDKSGPKDLIDKFIEENPSIQRRNLGADKTDLSEKSTQWKPDIASEYLAEIYLKQGMKKRAIQIYEVLILKFPEKKSYFAALIEKVQA